MKPEGYRKSIRLMKLADKFNLPIILFIDTPGAYPGVGAEERGQAEAIARSIECSMSIGVPTISIIIGEGGSGGAIALASSNKIIMLENAIYSVISPEGCASILWRDPTKTLEAAKAMKLTSKDLLNLKIIDEIIPEPTGGAHRDIVAADGFQTFGLLPASAGGARNRSSTTTKPWPRRKAARAWRKSEATHAVQLIQS